VIWKLTWLLARGIVARATSFKMSKRVNGKSADIVTAATISLLELYKAAVLTITADNGKEFAYNEKMTAALDATMYFANPYSSWHRGWNENTNGLLRQYWPKKTSFRKVTNRNVTSVIVTLNNRPRKKLNYQTPPSKMAEHMPALAV
jgi:IS30 family transposase